MNCYKNSISFKIDAYIQKIRFEIFENFESKVLMGLGLKELEFVRFRKDSQEIIEITKMIKLLILFYYQCNLQLIKPRISLFY